MCTSRRETTCVICSCFDMNYVFNMYTISCRTLITIAMRSANYIIFVWCGSRDRIEHKQINCRILIFYSDFNAVVSIHLRRHSVDIIVPWKMRLFAIHFDQCFWSSACFRNFLVIRLEFWHTYTRCRKPMLPCHYSKRTQPCAQNN